ncbi:MAG: PKD domain-containing protein, partial [Ginsengibacter sp.]
LPPAQPAFIWYPYDASPDFPQVGSGGRNAMAGPVYYTDMFPKSSRYPDYYNNRLFIYEWIRGWVKVVTMKKNGDFDKMEPFMEHTKFANPIDMEVGPDGKLYVLEYGTGWFLKNADAGLSRIDYNGGNRVPKIIAVNVNKLSGNLPLKVTATVDAKDPEKDKLTYLWNFGNGMKKQTEVPNAEYTYTVPGEYSITVEVADKENSPVKSQAINIYAGNEEPVVDIDISGNKTFYFSGKPVAYNVDVKQDGKVAVIDTSNLMIMADYVESGNRAAVPLGHLAGAAAISGRVIMEANDCKSCHKENDKSIGPSFNAVSVKYKNDPKALGYLADKIKKGGSGVWGETAMSAHPDLPDNDLQQIVQWVLSLNSANEKKRSLPPSGSLNSTLGKPLIDRGVLYLTATYTNKAGAGIKPLTGRKTITLKNSKIVFNRVNQLKGFTKDLIKGTAFLIAPKSEGWFSIDTIDISGVTAAELSIGYQKDVEYGYDFEIRLDKADGKILGVASLLPSVAKGDANFKSVKFKWDAVTDNKMHNLYIISKPKDANEKADIGLASLQLLLK